MKKYTHTFIVNAPIAAVRDFHSHSASMGAITPPPVIVRVHEAPDVLENGDRMDFTMWLGPMPIRWLAEIEKTEPNAFVDRQIQGPFAVWEHTHSFVAIDDNHTEVHDEVCAELEANWLKKLIGWGMWLNMPILFAFRAWKTKRILEKEATSQFQPSNYAS